MLKQLKNSITMFTYCKPIWLYFFHMVQQKLLKPVCVDHRLYIPLMLFTVQQVWINPPELCSDQPVHQRNTIINAKRQSYTKLL